MLWSLQRLEPHVLLIARQNYITQGKGKIRSQYIFNMESVSLQIIVQVEM